MAYDEHLAQRIRDIVGTEPGTDEKKMFGGPAVLLDGNMAVGCQETRSWFGSELMPSKRC